MRFVLFILSLIAFLGAIATASIGALAAIYAAVGMLTSAVLFSAACIIDGIVVNQKRMLKVLGAIAEDSTIVRYQIEKSSLPAIAKLLDPDGTKSRLVEAEDTKREFREMQDAAAEKKAREDQAAAEKARKEAADLSKKVVDAACPTCQKKIRIADLRPGVRHTCPECNTAFRT